jgi:uridine kinase
VGIVGGSGSGKSWLGGKLQSALAPLAASLSLDDFYRDRSHLPLARRARLNFDHPSAIDWAELERVLSVLLRGRRARVVAYDFNTQSRLARRRTLEPKAVILVEGLWLFWRPSIRKLFKLRVFLDCSRALRLRRRLARDLLARGRSRSSILKQFRTTVEPMHRQYVAPQVRFADFVLTGTCSREEIEQLALRILRIA